MTNGKGLKAAKTKAEIVRTVAAVLSAIASVSTLIVVLWVK